MEIISKLRGGDLRSIGRVDEVVSDILTDRSLFEKVFNGMVDADPVIRMRAADAVEKVTRITPQWLIPFKKILIEEVPKIEQQEVQWHLAQMFSRLDLEGEEIDKIIKLLQRWIECSKSKIVKVNSIQCLYDMTLMYTSLKPLVIKILRKSMENGGPAVVSRTKKLLCKLDAEGI